MPRDMRRILDATVLLAGIAYVAIGTGTTVLAGSASSLAAVKAWRLAAWLLSLVVFGLHFAMERRRSGSHLHVAVRVALGVALGALGVAALGPARAHWADPSRTKLILLSLVAWPIITGVPAFATALMGGMIVDRLRVTGQRSGSRAT